MFLLLMFDIPTLLSGLVEPDGGSEPPSVGNRASRVRDAAFFGLAVQRLKPSPRLSMFWCNLALPPGTV
jgi:hypothetical protein